MFDLADIQVLMKCEATLSRGRLLEWALIMSCSDGAVAEMFYRGLMTFSAARA